MPSLVVLLTKTYSKRIKLKNDYDNIGNKIKDHR